MSVYDDIHSKIEWIKDEADGLNEIAETVDAVDDMFIALQHDIDKGDMDEDDINSRIDDIRKKLR